MRVTLLLAKALSPAVTSASDENWLIRTHREPFQLPALRKLGELAGRAPTIIVDTREQNPLTFERLESRVGTLQIGDYSIAVLEELFAVERKSIPDRVRCCVRGIGSGSNASFIDCADSSSSGIGTEREIRQCVCSFPGLTRFRSWQLSARLKCVMTVSYTHLTLPTICSV